MMRTWRLSYEELHDAAVARTTSASAPAGAGGRRDLSGRAGSVTVASKVSRFVGQLRLRRRTVAHAAHVGRRLAVQLTQRWSIDHVQQLGAALAYQTSLSLVPLMALGLALLKGTGALEARSALVLFFTKQVLPVTGDDVAVKLTAFADNINIGGLGAMGLGTTLLLSYLLFHNLEKNINFIWRSPRRRTLSGKLVVFYTLITMVPFLLGLSLYESARLFRTLGPLHVLAPLVFTFVALLIAYKLLPTVMVRWRPAIAGAAISAIAFETLKIGFQYYVATVAFRSYSGIYGKLGLVPILLIWIYVSWLVMLFGVELSYAAQNSEALEAERSSPTAVASGVQWPGVMAARVAVQVARRFAQGLGATSYVDLAPQGSGSERELALVVERLVERHLLLKINSDPLELVPGRPLEQLHVEDVMSSFGWTGHAGEVPDAAEPADGAGATPAAALAADPLERSLLTAEGAWRATVRSLTLADLVDSGPSGAPNAPMERPPASRGEMV
jgi:membrane protein